MGLPVPLETFVAYGLEFQRRLVPMLEETDVTLLRQTGNGFELATANGQTMQARRVIVATGISYFGYLPPVFANLPTELVSHSSDHHDLDKFAGKRVAVLGAGASALDIAALLHEAGAQVELVARRSKIAFHNFLAEPRPLLQRLRNPRSGLGIGWRSRLATDAPLLFHAMPEKFRLRVVRTHLGPAPGWFIRQRTEGKFPMHLGAAIESTSVSDGKVRLSIAGNEAGRTELTADHLIAATGYNVSVTKLRFLDDVLRRKIDTVEDSPVLSTSFQTSVPGLYMVGLASANSFGPLTRFAYGAGFTSRHIVRHLRAQARTSIQPQRQAGKVGLAVD
jgi:thioredoxin reductase